MKVKGKKEKKDHSHVCHLLSCVVVSSAAHLPFCSTYPTLKTMPFSLSVTFRLEVFQAYRYVCLCQAIEMFIHADIKFFLFENLSSCGHEIFFAFSTASSTLTYAILELASKGCVVEEQGELNVWSTDDTSLVVAFVKKTSIHCWDVWWRHSRHGEPASHAWWSVCLIWIR